VIDVCDDGDISDLVVIHCLIGLVNLSEATQGHDRRQKGN